MSETNGAAAVELLWELLAESEIASMAYTGVAGSASMLFCTPTYSNATNMT
ncbi:MAG: hypothetical protein ACI9HK_003834, partial [Pirellulaceae bacterium]